MTNKEEQEIKQRMADLDFGAESINSTVEMLKFAKEHDLPFLKIMLKTLRDFS